jgi:hypothetical protein
MTQDTLLSPETKRRRGRPKHPLAQTFTEALNQCTPKEAQFVRHVLADKPYANAYRLVSTEPLTPRSAQVGASKLAKRDRVVHAIKLGREEGAVAAISGLKHDLRAAFDELGRVLDAAMANNQYTAAARACELRAKLFKLLDSNSPLPLQGVTFVFKRYQPEAIEHEADPPE